MSNVIDKLLTDAQHARRDGRPEQAKQVLLEAVALARKAGTRDQLARALTALGQIERDLGQLSQSCQLYQEAVSIYRTDGNGPRLAHAIRHLADIHRSAGTTDLAEPCYDEALRLYRNDQATTPLELANAIRGLAILKGDKGDFPRASALWMEARDLYKASGVDEGVAESERRLAELSCKSAGST
ncbi:MAG TPA: tetratricopeptide repeat protein [Terriglobales bacterium]|nr:tetratricopeptide repeat protein [Terriglobales bacterium]